MQVASTEWFLGVQIQDFVNLYNVEIINETYCCCYDNQICLSDSNSLLTLCKDSSTTPPCETYFLVHVRDHCLNSGACLVSRIYQLNYQSSDSMFDNGILSIPFKEMELGDGVKAKISYLLR